MSFAEEVLYPIQNYYSRGYIVGILQQYGLERLPQRFQNAKQHELWGVPGIKSSFTLSMLPTFTYITALKTMDEFGDYVKKLHLEQLN
ncbi:hypothetical protein V5T82_10215 [Magnetovibrio sp. PR-2]|uniref:hypothetical protein n=1 Tax=Magnetovibrio sp. PR-2 TaxID=3120356 RepID=UPI002FCDFC73